MVTDVLLDTAPPERTFDWLVGGGEMGNLVRAHDWSKTPLGAIQGWPQSLRSAVSIMLPSKAQIALFWGPDLITLYNDAYRPVFGGKHPHALGQPIRESWSELWAAGLKELFEGVLATGEAYWAKDRPFYMERHGYPEETFFDVSYDPVRDESGRVGGVFCIVSETSRRVIGERRLKVLRDLGSVAVQARSVAEAWTLSARVLAGAPLDIPFADADLEGQADWPLGLHDVETVQSRMTTAGGPWPEPARRVMVLPLGERPDGNAGKIALGVSSRLAFDDDYDSFFQLVAGQVAASIAAARAVEDERRRAEALAEIDRAKTAFFNNVSHEFRTPLTLMLGPLEELRQELAGGPAGAENPQLRQVDLIHRNGLRLLKQVNTLLDFSRIEAGRVQASFEPVDLPSYTAELASVFRAAVEKAGLKLMVDCPPAPDPAYVDRDMWEKIVLNLISNAFKFTFEGEVEVRLHAEPAQFVLAVRDTGTGIPRDELPKLFERFHRVAGARGRTHEGSGIGLALVQELVKLHGGTIAVDSVLGQGSSFQVTIPTGCRHLPAERIGAARTQASTAVGANAFVEEALRWLPDAGPAHVLDAPDVGATNDTEADPEARVLLADDNADMRDYLHRLLAGRYDVEAVSDGEAALAAVARTKPDLILSDIMMPRLDGMQLLQRLRANPETSSIPIIFLSARAGEESRVEGLAGGADDYLIKPFSARELLARVDTHVRLKRLRERSQLAVQEKREEAEILNEVSLSLGGELDLQKLVQGVTDAGTRLARAKFGAFFYNSVNAQGESYLLYALSGAPREAFEKFGTPRNTPVFGPTFAGQGIVRSEDITKDPRYGQMGPHHGMPKGHLPVRSYLAVPVIARAGEVLGGLFFGHPEVGVFTEQSERLAAGIAAQAAVAIENARLYEQAQRELAERTRAEEALRENEERLRLAMAAGRMGTWDWNIETGTVKWSPGLEEIHGLAPGTFEGSFAAYQKDIHPEDRERVLGKITGTVESGEDHHVEYRIVRPDGSLRWVNGHGKLFRNGAGKPIRMIGLCRDVTERKHAEEALRESETRFRNLADNIAQLAWTCDKLGNCTWYNKRWLDYTGLSFEEMKDWGWMQVQHPEHVDRVVAGVTRSRESGEPWEDTFPLRGKDGKYRWFLSRATPIHNARGEVVRWFGTNTDITEQREAELALKESEVRFRNMADHAPVMVWVTEPDGSCSFLSQSWYEFTGQTPETGLGFGWLDATHADDRRSAGAAFAEANARREAFRLEYRLRRKDGEYRWAIDAAAPRFGATGEFLGYIGSVIDITERKNAEETKNLLIGELNHRVKNTLAVVQAIAQQTLAHTRDPSHFVASFAGRIQSMARVHAMLSRTTWQGADLQELIRDQVESGPVDESRLTAWGPEVRLEPQTALHLALILHELGTNACKYGALSVAGGCVTVTWSVGDTLRLEWAERGGPSVASPSRRGFGTTLIEQGARAQGGDAKMLCRRDGITWTIDLPLRESGDFATSRPAPQNAPPSPEAPGAGGTNQLSLAGRRFLVVEDEPLIGLDIVAGLEDADAQVEGPVGTVEKALDLVERGTFDGALLDANLGGQPVDAIASALARRKVPFLFVTGYGPESLPQAFRDVAVLAKPFTAQQVLEATVQLMAKPGEAAPRR